MRGNKKIFSAIAVAGMLLSNLSDFTQVRAEEESTPTPEVGVIETAQPEQVDDNGVVLTIEQVDGEPEETSVPTELPEVTAEPTVEPTVEPTPEETVVPTAEPTVEPEEDNSFSLLEFDDEPLVGNGETEEDTQTIVMTVLFEGQGIGSEAERQARPVTILATLQSSIDGETWTDVADYSLMSVPQVDGDPAWTETVTGLPKTDSEGNTLVYRVVQQSLTPVYVTTYDNPIIGEDGTQTFQLRNTYVEGWNYKLDLYWSGRSGVEKYKQDVVTLSTDANTPTATISVKSQKEYKAEMLQVRIPRYLYDNAGVINRVPIGDYTSPSEDKDYTYRIDDMGTRMIHTMMNMFSTTTVISVQVITSKSRLSISLVRLMW